MNLIACTSNRASIHLFGIKKSIEKCIENKQYGFNQQNDNSQIEGENKKSKLQFLKIFAKYFNSEWSATKIKIDEKIKTVGFDSKNHKLIIITYDRILYYVSIPEQYSRYIDEAELRTFKSDYTYN